MNVLTATSLTKKYGSAIALDSINFSLKRGHIYGFIGENGAGKTTLFRIISGLSFKTSGELNILGETTNAGFESVRQRIGSMIESPALYLNLSARKNLELQGILAGTKNSEIDNILGFVGLAETKDKKARRFSMGMKQRLSLALCLINKPEILLLDEPVNGLDPTGIAEFRELLGKLCTENNTTVLMSSHILSELYLLATDYLIIHKGRIVECLTHEELDNKCKKYLLIQMDDKKGGLAALEKQFGTLDYFDADDTTINLYGTHDIKAVATLLNDHHILVTQLSTKEQSLEEFYFSVVGRDLE